MPDESLVAKLKSEVAAGRVVVIAGTGVSVAASGNPLVDGHQVATWTGLLEHGVAYGLCRGLLDDFDTKFLPMQIASARVDYMVKAAETLAERLSVGGGSAYLDWLADSVGVLKVTDPAVPQAVAALGGLLATLNYDGLLEEVTGWPAVTWQQRDAVQQVLRREAKGVLHLHGWWQSPETVVLGLRSYDQVRDDEHANGVRQLLAMGQTMVFIGCNSTLSDPNFTALIDWCKSALAGVRAHHFVLCCQAELAGVRAMLDGAPWFQPVVYGESYGGLAPFLRSLAPAQVDTGMPSSVRRALDLGAYREAMIKQYGHLSLEYVDSTTYDTRELLLTGMFVEQEARECAEYVPRVYELPKDERNKLRSAGDLDDDELDEEDLDGHRRAYLDQSPRPVLQVVDDPDMARLVVLGDPGSGKSTLLRYLLLRWAEGGDESAPLPLLIELREYARLRAAGEANGFVHWLASGENARWHLGEAALGDWLDTWPSLVLFDGLDEVFDPTLRGEVTTAIHRFADEHPLARVVLTSRVIGYQHPTWRDNGFRHVMLEDLDEAHIAEFLTRWHERAYVDDPALGQRKRASLAGAIENSKAIAQLAGNPLLLTMMAIINRTQELPRDRVDLYEQCTRLLLYQWKADQAFVTDPELSRAHLDYRDKRDLMMRVAAAMQSSEGGLAGNFIDEATLEATLAEGLSGCADVRRERAARALIQQLRGRNFMLSSLGSGKYAFVHRTFLEYFAALAILDQFQAKQTLTREQLKEGIYGHWPDEVWHEVLCLLAAMLDAGVVAEVVEWLLAKPDDDYTCHHLFLAARCVGEVRSRAELGAVSQRVLERMQALTMVGVVLHMERRGAGWSVVRGLSCRAVEAVATVWRNEPSVLMWLRECAQSARGAEVRQSAVQELARGWKDDPETLAIVKARAQSDEYEDVRRTALEELARGWRDDPETLAIVKERAKSDDDTQVRECAVRALARGWTVDPETLVLVTTLVQSDDNAFVRRTALKELVHGWKRDPATPCILRASAQSDDDEFVRQGAVEELARGWREDPDALAIVEACAQHDEAWQVRQAAVLELACGWSADPATPDIIRGCAETDRSEWVREVALQEMARGWQRSPETAPWLKERAQWDLSGRVRKCAVQELARGWRRDPGTESWLKALAASEEDRAVWQGAVHGLARGWPGDVEAWAIVKSRALSDDDRWIRRSAAQELARGWRNTPQTAAVLRLIARSDGSAAVRESALEELAHGWHGDPETVALLAELERSDGDAGVRRIAAALRAFGPGTPAFGDSWPT